MGLSLRNAEDLKKKQEGTLLLIHNYCSNLLLLDCKTYFAPIFSRKSEIIVIIFIVIVCYACLPCLHIFRLWIALNSTYGLLIFQKGAKGDEGDIGQSGELGSVGTKGTLTRSSQPWSYNSTWNWYIIIMLHQSLHILYNFILWTRPWGQRI